MDSLGKEAEFAGMGVAYKHARRLGADGHMPHEANGPAAGSQVKNTPPVPQKGDAIRLQQKAITAHFGRDGNGSKKVTK